MKKVLIAGGALALFLGGRYAYNLAKVGNNMVIEQSISAAITKRNFLGIPTELTLTINLLLKNPTNGSLTINTPFIQVFAKEDDKSAIASSAAVNKDYTVPQLGQVQIDPIAIKLNLVSLASIAATLYKQIAMSDPFGLWIKSTAYINGSIKQEKMEFKTINLPG